MYVKDLNTAEAKSLLTLQREMDTMLGKMMDKAAEKHADFLEVPGHAWVPGDRCEDAVMGGHKLDACETAVSCIVEIELQIAARMDAAKRVNSQEDEALD